MMSKEEKETIIMKDQKNIIEDHINEEKNNKQRLFSIK